MFDFEALSAAIVRQTVLCVGDLMLDEFVYGEVSRISPEAPAPVIAVQRSETSIGGAGNVARNIASLGARCIFVGLIGDDGAGAQLKAALARESGIESVLVCDSTRPTTRKVRFVSEHFSAHMLRADWELASPASAGIEQKLIDAILPLLPRADIVLLSDYAKGVLEPKLCQAVIAEARKLSVPVLVDPKTADFSRYKGATTICPNLQELSTASREDIRNLDAMLAAGERMVTDFDLEYLTATLSEKGIAVIRPGNRYLAPAVARQVFDVSGAGDTVISVLSLCLASGLAIEPAVQLANIAAGIVVGKVGTVPVEKHELLAALAPDIALHAEDKVLSRDELVRRVSTWRANGERVVFTNGCFDLLHVGHITVLEQSRRQGDRLIVAINSDASVSGLKGPSRPVVGERERARVLAALAAVDAVVVFGEPTPLELIVASRPDVIVKGGDYNEDTVVGAKEVKSWGGRVAIVPIVEGHSTTRLIERSLAGK